MAAEPYAHTWQVSCEAGLLPSCAGTHSPEQTPPGLGGALFRSVPGLVQVSARCLPLLSPGRDSNVFTFEKILFKSFSICFFPHTLVVVGTQPLEHGVGEKFRHTLTV